MTPVQKFYSNPPDYFARSICPIFSYGDAICMAAVNKAWHAMLKKLGLAALEGGVVDPTRIAIAYNFAKWNAGQAAFLNDVTFRKNLWQYIPQKCRAIQSLKLNVDDFNQFSAVCKRVKFDKLLHLGVNFLFPRYLQMLRTAAPELETLTIHGFGERLLPTISDDLNSLKLRAISFDDIREDEQLLPL